MRSSDLIRVYVIALVSVVVVADDVKCLEGLKNSSGDPQGMLSSWQFSNITTVCGFIGVECNQEKHIFALTLSTMKLTGEFPDSLQYCQSLLSVNLSNNNFYGRIPSQICTWLPRLASLYLSGNDFSGPIPPEFGNCKYLTTLLLDNNQLSGPIPSELSGMKSLSKLSVANNHLSGPIPYFLSIFDPANFKGNKLCGQPLPTKCAGMTRKQIISISLACVFGFTVILIFVIWRYKKYLDRKLEEDRERSENMAMG